MFFRPTPSKWEQARRAASAAASSAADAAQSALGTAIGGARSAASAAPQFAGDAAHSFAGVAQEIRDAVAGALHPADGSGKDADAVETAAIKAQSAKQAAELAARGAERAARNADAAAQAQLERAQRDAAQKRAEFEAEQERLEARAEELAQARHDAHIRAAEVAALPDYDDFQDEPRVVAKESGGSKLLFLVGALVFVSAALLYFFKSGKGGDSRSALEERLAKVKDDATDKLESAAPSPTELSPVAPPARDEKMAEVLEMFSTPTESAVMAPSAAPVVEVAVRVVQSAQGVEAYEPLGHMETTGATVAADEEVPHPNVFDKVAQVVGKAASAAEHLAGEDAVHAHEAEVAPDAIK